MPMRRALPAIWARKRCHSLYSSLCLAEPPCGIVVAVEHREHRLAQLRLGAEVRKLLNNPRRVFHTTAFTASRLLE